ncbi:unnamed protein product, partial [Phaeothamnion confervicola]
MDADYQDREIITILSSSSPQYVVKPQPRSGAAAALLPGKGPGNGGSPRLPSPTTPGANGQQAPPWAAAGGPADGAFQAQPQYQQQQEQRYGEVHSPTGASGGSSSPPLGAGGPRGSAEGTLTRQFSGTSVADQHGNSAFFVPAGRGGPRYSDDS